MDSSFIEIKIFAFNSHYFPEIELGKHYLSWRFNCFEGKNVNFKQDTAPKIMLIFFESTNDLAFS